MINLEEYLQPIKNLFIEQQEQAQLISVKYHDPFNNKEIIDKIKDTRVKLMDYFEEHPEDSI